MAVTPSVEDVTDGNEAGRSLAACRSCSNVTCRAVAALRKEASGQSSQPETSAGRAASDAAARPGRACDAALSHPQINRQAANTHRSEAGSNTATSSFIRACGAAIVVSIRDGPRF